MATAAVAFFVSLCVALALTRGVRDFAIRRGLLDLSRNSRKIHNRPVPRLGGVAILAAFNVPLLGLLLFDTSTGRIFWEDWPHALGLIAGGFVISCLGVYDDLFGAGAKLKFLVQFGVALVVYWLGFRIDVIANPFGAPIFLGILGLPLTLLWIVGVINALNLIDGLDGLAGGVGLFAAITTLVLAIGGGQALPILYMAALAGALSGFLVYNFNPASIFMGDSGSMFLGFVLATTSIQTSRKASTAVALLAPILMLGVPILDTLLAIARRAARGRPLFSADKEHLHHKLLGLGLTQRQAALVIYGICATCGALALLLTYSRSSLESFALLAIAVGLAALLLRRLGYFSGLDIQGLAELRRENHALREAAKHIRAAAERARNEAGVWEGVRPLADAVSADAIEMVLPPNGGTGSCSVFMHRRSPSSRSIPPGLRADIDIPSTRFPGAKLTLIWNDGRSEIERDHEIAAESVCLSVAHRLDRLPSSSRHGRGVRFGTAE